MFSTETSIPLAVFLILLPNKRLITLHNLPPVEGLMIPLLFPTLRPSTLTTAILMLQVLSLVSNSGLDCHTPPSTSPDFRFQPSSTLIRLLPILKQTGRPERPLLFPQRALPPRFGYRGPRLKSSLLLLTQGRLQEARYVFDIF